MTEEQRNKIVTQRLQGYSYTAIARATGLSKDSVKGFCRYHQITSPADVPSRPNVEKPGICPNCGAPVEKPLGKRVKRFCCASCCQAWWRAHPGHIQKKAIYNYICAGCGKPFSAYGNSHRKYCSHACYVSARFQNGGRQ